MDALRKIQPRTANSFTGETSFPAGALEVSFDHISFAYQPGEPVLKDLSFQLAPGGVLGVLGRTGSGKTTLTRLLFRLYEPVSGSIKLGGMDLQSTALTALRRRIGIVTQEVQIFRASVRDNLTLFDATIPDERLIDAIQDLELGDWLHSLPSGLDTQLASGGKSLSAGEAQLLAFARIFLRDPGLVILDEASSRLDPATGQRIERAIDRLLRGRTAMVIAHRLDTVQRCGQILILEDGRISEFGQRDQLAGDPASRFAGLLRTGLEEVLA